MASLQRQKTALKATVLAFLGGAHYVTTCMGRSVSGKAADDLQTVHLADYERFVHSPEALDALVTIFNEENLYPFGERWPLEALRDISSRVIPPLLSTEVEEKFRFRPGFNLALKSAAESVTSDQRAPRTGDHWLALLLNVAFYAGISAAAQLAENSKSYFSALPEIETEIEPWSRYRQIVELFERQLGREARRRTGAVTTEDWDS